MARYIDANKLQEDFEKIADEPDYMHEGETWQTGIYMAGTITDKQPTADVVEVVWCSECKKGKPMIFAGFYFCKRHRKCRTKYCFCSDGERKNDFKE